MPRPLNKLSAKFVKNASTPGRYADGGGLYLQVTEGKGGVTKAWLFRYQRGGKTSREMGLGTVSVTKRDGFTTLEEARQKGTKAREMLKAGLDPLDVKHADRVAKQIEKATALTFKECAEDYIEANKPGWKNGKHIDQWKMTILGLDRNDRPAKNDYCKLIRDLPVAAIDDALVMKVLQPIWIEKTETASRIRGRIEKVLDRARALKLRTGENPARWVGHLDQLLPNKSQVSPVEHHAALPYGELPEFMAKLRAKEGVSARALEFTILTAARTGDTIGAVPAEFDSAAKTWTVPAARLKGKKGARKRDHVVPLSGAASQVLEAVASTLSFTFPGDKKDGGLSDMAMAELLKGMGYGSEKATVHGFRSTFRDWAAEQTSYPNEMCEMALAHTVSDKVEAAYRRGDMREKRRRLMEDWAAYCNSPVARGDNVSPLRRKVSA